MYEAIAALKRPEKEALKMRSVIREHLHFIVVVTLLTLVMTFPTIVYVFRTDVFWLPTGQSHDVYIALWDVWYGAKVLTGQADRFFTDLMFYPEGVSLAYHPLVIPHIIPVNLLNLILPFAGAFNLGFLLIILASTLTAYIYLNWLLRDKWIALFGAVIFGCSPHVLGHPNHPAIAYVASMPVTIYCFHRGVQEDRLLFVGFAGLFAGLSSWIIMYVYICILITLGLFTCALALSKWKEKRFWIQIGLLIASVFAFSILRIYPLMADSQAQAQAAAWYGNREPSMDIMSFFINLHHPIFGPAALSIFQTPVDARLSPSVFLGYLPLGLIGFGFCRSSNRRSMASWAALGVVFFVLQLGSFLYVNGTLFGAFPLPKYFLDRLFPSVFRSFFQTDILHMGLLLPVAVLSSYGLSAFLQRRAMQSRHLVVLLLVAVVAFEYYIPKKENSIPREEFEFIDWLAATENESEIRLINLPMGRKNSKRYNLYQALSGYPHAEGAISRTPDRAFDYIRANPILEFWNRNLPITCSLENRDNYLSALSQVEADGFTHVVFHQNVGNRLTVVDSFENADPSYKDDFVWIFDMDNLRESCPN